MDSVTVDPLMKQIALTLWARRGLVVIFFVIANALSWIGFTLMSPIYESSALIQTDYQNPYSSTTGRDGGGAMRQDEYLNTQAMILKSDDVVRPAIAEIGVDNLYPARTDRFTSIKNNIISVAAQGWLWTFSNDEPGLASNDPRSAEAQDALANRAYAKASAALFVRTEPKTDLIRISFRNTNPVLAARFVNVLVKRYFNRHIELASNANNASFMEAEKFKFNAQFAMASEALSLFSTKNDLYSVDAQQEIILSQRKELQLKMVETAGAISQREAEIGEVSRQLVLLKLNTLSPQLASLAHESDRNANIGGRSPRASSASAVPLPLKDPPLLLVRVYQDTAEILVKKNAELTGLRELASRLKTQLSDFDHELSRLSAKRADFEQLKRNVDLARHNADAFATKEIEQKTELALDRQKLIRLQLVQEAVVPWTPAFPTMTVKLITGVLVALLTVMALAVASRFGCLKQPTTVPPAPVSHGMSSVDSDAHLGIPPLPPYRSDATLFVESDFLR